MIVLQEKQVLAKDYESSSSSVLDTVKACNERDLSCGSDDIIIMANPR